MRVISAAVIFMTFLGGVVGDHCLKFTHCIDCIEEKACVFASDYNGNFVCIPKLKLAQQKIKRTYKSKATCPKLSEPAPLPNSIIKTWISQQPPAVNPELSPFEPAPTYTLTTRQESQIPVPTPTETTEYPITVETTSYASTGGKIDEINPRPSRRVIDLTDISVDGISSAPGPIINQEKIKIPLETTSHASFGEKIDEIKPHPTRPTFNLTDISVDGISSAPGPIINPEKTTIPLETLPTLTTLSESSTTPRGLVGDSQAKDDQGRTAIKDWNLEEEIKLCSVFGFFETREQKIKRSFCRLSKFIQRRKMSQEFFNWVTASPFILDEGECKFLMDRRQRCRDRMEFASFLV